jgi:hypothetical protein
MNSAAEILVVVLSIFLAIFLLLGIILTVYLIKLTSQIRIIVKSTEKTVGHVESVVAVISKVISPIYAAEMLAGLVNKFKKEKRG